MDSDVRALLSIKRAIQQISKYTKYGWGAFEAEELFPVWTIWHLQTIHSIAGRISPPFRDQHPELPSTLFQGISHLIAADDNLSVNLEAVWLVTSERLPPLEESIDGILRRCTKRAGVAP